MFHLKLSSLFKTVFWSQHLLYNLFIIYIYFWLVIFDSVSYGFYYFSFFLLNCNNDVLRVCLLFFCSAGLYCSSEIIVLDHERVNQWAKLFRHYDKISYCTSFFLNFPLMYLYHLGNYVVLCDCGHVNILMFFVFGNYWNFNLFCFKANSTADRF